ncbi:MAG: LysR family transcriptional regulator [Sideroxydans sp.]|nr:LysR family transcriptional regulator [Sideroxydans sp.]
MEQIDISSDDLLLFTAIAEQGSLVRAAGHLDMPKATVSRRLGNLEAQLGQKLLVRTTRRLMLTEFGLAFLDHCQRVAEEVAATKDFVRSQEAQPRGHLRVSMPSDYDPPRLSRAVATFIQQYPEIQLDLDLSSRRVDLIGERFDLAIRMGTLESDATLVARKIDEQQFGLYASPIYFALRPVPETPDDLMRHEAIRLRAARGAPVPWKLIKGKATWEQVPPGRLTLNSLGVIQQLLLDGAGIGALPDRFAAEDVLQKRLIRVLPEWCLPSVPAWAVMPTRRYLPTKTRAFLAHLENFLEKA